MPCSHPSKHHESPQYHDIGQPNQTPLSSLRRLLPPPSHGHNAGCTSQQTYLRDGLAISPVLPLPQPPCQVLAASLLVAPQEMLGLVQVISRCTLRLSLPPHAV